MDENSKRKTVRALSSPEGGQFPLPRVMPRSISQNRVAIRIAEEEFLDYLNAGARLRTQRDEVELSHCEGYM
jgi:hypothetical protein